ncbi:MAG: rhodanese-like domain-containing protein [Bacteroidota bacterium]|nr:rhodanese-like domain-containing protein [Candidatus Kapabacteria bacterium]MCS7302258.1 rhodanese-like domain-containing protein [Candidatus Kapabacteria bacterium]MDW8074878.1 rhodanese-like domain-containing protein [Bacteroidota bacterium]MDW8271517.1 rhodanese-like domain-containing protein [Bacteroidota bacterium]
MLKTTLRDAAIIIGTAVVLAVVYNAAFSVKPLPWIRQPRVMDTLSTEALVSLLPLQLTDTTAAAAKRDTLPGAQRIRPADTSLQQRTEPRLPPKNDAISPSEQGGIRAVTYKQVLMMLRNEDVLFFDARRRDEFDQGHIPRAQNVDIQLFELDPTYRSSMMQMLYSLDKRRPVVTYCGGGNCELSHKLSEVLKSIGFEHVFIYTGGWNEYSSKPDAPREP